MPTEIPAGGFQGKAGQRFAAGADGDDGPRRFHVLCRLESRNRIFDCPGLARQFPRLNLPQFDPLDSKRAPIDRKTLDPFRLVGSLQATRELKQLGLLLGGHMVDDQAELPVRVGRQTDLVAADIHIARVVEDQRIIDQQLARLPFPTTVDPHALFEVLEWCDHVQTRGGRIFFIESNRDFQSPILQRP